MRKMKGDVIMDVTLQRHNYLQCSFFTLSCILMGIFFSVSAHARMTEVSESELSLVSAQSGINYVIGDSRLRITTGSYRISDTDSSPYNWIELNNISVDDGNGNYFSMDTPIDDYYAWNTLDVATTDDGLTKVYLKMSLGVEPRTYTIGNFVFCSQDLGSIRLENLRRTPADMLLLSGRNDGTSGINLEYQTELILDSAKFIYNTSPISLDLNGIHLAGTVGGAPEDPSAWTFSGKFKFGDFQTDNPVTIDVATGTNLDGTTSTSLIYNVPMNGSLRVQSVDFGGNNFGPCAIDGINVHHLGIQIPGN
jgi:hypothetical protein